MLTEILLEYDRPESPVLARFRCRQASDTQKKAVRACGRVVHSLIGNMSRRWSAPRPSS